MSEKFSKYGYKWASGTSPLHIEFWNIKKGEEWLKQQGRSLFFHYKEAQKLLWPEEDHHRWSDLILQEIVQNDITVLLGSKDSGKTHGMTKFGLTDYFCFPDETLIIVSSTDIRSLEGRVWGDIKAMFTRAKELHDWLPGVVIDSKHAICTDDISDEDVIARDMRKGILCFVKGSMVSTPNGLRPIEEIKVGDEVLNVLGTGNVTETFQRSADTLAKITLSDGRTIRCTPEHKVFTNHGWIQACNLTRIHYMMSVYESMQVLQNPNEEQIFLQQELQGEMDDDARRSGGVLHAGARGEDCCLEKEVASRQPGSLWLRHPQDANSDKNSGCGAGKEDFNRASSIGLEASHSWRERNRSNQGGKGVAGNVSPSRQEQLFSSNQETQRKWLSPALQSGCGFAGMEVGNRGGRKLSLLEGEAGARREENQPANGSWVDSVEIYKPENLGGHSECEGGTAVYNLEISGHPSYVINGILVHNCVPCKTSSGGQTNIAAYVGMKQKRRRYLADEMQFMSQSMYESLGNANSGNFKMVCAGNPIGQGDPLDLLSEPKGGWELHPEPEKTATWDNEKFLRSRSINLVGTDSPNFDYDQSLPIKYHYLTNRDSIARTVAGYGIDSHQYYSQCKGVRRSGLNARRVITQELCKKFNAFDDAIWEGATTKIAAVDAAYGFIGGDRCVGGHIEFGKCVDGKIRMLIAPQQIVPVNIRRDDSPEDQIAWWARSYCERNNIPPENFFYDATGRGSLGPALARIWSAAINPVEFGGVATPRPVSQDTFIDDPKTGMRRLKRCDEHYRKFVTELWWSARLVIESDQMRGLSQDLCREGCMREWKEVAGGKIEVETKAETKERMGRSPDLFDQLVTAIEGARRRGFQITKLGKDVAKSSNTSILQRLAKQHESLLSGKQLQGA
jgi:hypothetical protein